MKTNDSIISSVRNSLGALIFVAGCAAAYGQAAPPAETAGTGVEEEETVVLSPFQVRASDDHGYVASRDVAGSRINTQLKDIAAPITVFTAELLQDINAYDLHSAQDYAPNVAYQEVGAAHQDFNGSNISMRGQSPASVTQDFFPVYDTLDLYKVDRLAFSSGPNSILFGIGQPTGVITSTTKQARFKDMYEFQTRFDSWGSARGMIDANVVLIPDRLAVRAVVLKQNQTGAIKPQYKKDERLFLTATAKLIDRPGFRTTVRGNFEWIDGDDLYSHTVLPQDRVTAWLAAGSPTTPLVNAGASSGTILPGTANASSANRLVMIGGHATLVDAPVLNWRNTLMANGTGSPIYTESVFPYDVNLKGGAAGVTPRKNTHGTLFLDQQIGQNFFVEAAAFRAKENRRWPIKSGAFTLRADPNRLLPNGSPNPNVGKLYSEYDGRTDDRFGVTDVYRVTAAYKLDFDRFGERVGKWLGWHQIFGLYERSDSSLVLERLQFVNTTPLAGYPTALNSPQNIVWSRAYLDPANGVDYLSFHDPRVPISRDGVNARAMPVQGQSASRTVIDSWVLAIQGHFWQDRIVPTIGWRQDEVQNYSSAAVAVNGLFPLARTLPLTPVAPVTFRPASKGVVFKPFEWVALHYNESENFAGVASSSRSVFGTQLPPLAGEGKDYGVRFELLKNRLSAKVNFYESGRVNSIANFNSANDINDIWLALGQPGRLMDPFPSTKVVSDETARGEEYTLFWNVTPNWRIYATVAHNKATKSNVNRDALRYIADNVAEWRQNGALATSDGRTVNEVADDIVEREAVNAAQEGVQVYNLREWTGSLSTNYLFDSGLLKGFSVGGNALYRGDAVVGVPVANGVPDVNHPYKEEGYWVVNVNVGYERTFAKRYRWDTRFSIQNALDYDGRVITTSRNTAGFPLVARWLPGTSVILTTGVKF